MMKGDNDIDDDDKDNYNGENNNNHIKEILARIFNCNNNDNK